MSIHIWKTFHLPGTNRNFSYFRDRVKAADEISYPIQPEKEQKRITSCVEDHNDHKQITMEDHNDVWALRNESSQNYATELLIHKLYITA